MRVLATPEFSKKLSALDKESVLSVKNVINRLNASSRNDIVNSSMLLKPSSVEGDVFVIKAGQVRIFCTLSNDATGEYALLLDIAQWANVPSFSQQPFAVREPKSNSIYNPSFNSQINPNFNSSLNPNFNSQINPNFNSSLNPNFNSQINPNFNSSLNPQFNSQINPKFNTSLNPQFNSAINPRYNPSFGGPYFYDLGANKTGYFIIANDQVILLFDNASNFIGTGVKNTVNGYTLFDLGNNWTGYLVPDGQEGYLHFNLNNTWIGFVV